MMLMQVENLPSVSLLLEEQFCISIIDLDGVISYVNQKFCEITKYCQEELIGQNYSLLNPAFEPQQEIPNIIAKLVKEKTTQLIVNGISKEGTLFWVQATLVPIYDEYGCIQKLVSFDIDITQRKMIENKYEQAIKDLYNVQNALDQSSVVAVTDAKGVITYVNEKFCELTQYTPDELIGKTHRIINSGTHPRSFFREMWSTIKSGEKWTGDIQNRAKDGSTYWVHTTIIPYVDETGEPYQYIAIRTDITTRKEAEQSLEIALKNSFRQTVKHLQNAIFQYKSNACGQLEFTLLEGKAVESLGLTIDHIQKRELFEFFTTKDLMIMKKHLYEGLTGNAGQFEIDCRQYTFLVYLSPIIEDGCVVEVVGTATDITERKQAENRIEQMAYYDYLTKLPNRRLFKQKVKEEIVSSEAHQQSFAILFLDLDEFKHINDSLGHAIGDQLLTEVGKRLYQSVPENSTVARIGGDEFVILLPETTSSMAGKVAQKIIEVMSETVDLVSCETIIGTSVGISLYPKDGLDYDTLMKHADSAMYKAKEIHKNNYQFFDKALFKTIADNIVLESDIRRAIRHDEFTLHYQPQIELQTKQMIGMEVLIRWKHPTRGIIAPGEFIPFAEDNGLIIPIGSWVLENACLQAKIWQNQGHSPLQINVNVSIHQFNQHTFVSQVEHILVKTGLAPHFLNLEITERVTTDASEFQQTLHELRKLGVKVSIDDFGTGYSSLSYLSRFPITDLKIDQEFLRELSIGNRAIVKSIIQLAHNLGLHVIAEGVETTEQLRFLEELQCDSVQGFYFSKPLPTDQMEWLLQQNKRFQ